MKIKESEIKNAIWQLCDAGRGFSPSIKSQVDLILVLLMWAKYFPYSDKKIIGFFDVLESIETQEKFNEIVIGLSKKLKFNVEWIVMFNPQKNSEEFLTFINVYRSSLIPIAKLLIKGDANDTQIIINILMVRIIHMLFKLILFKAVSLFGYIFVKLSITSAVMRKLLIIF